MGAQALAQQSHVAGARAWMGNVSGKSPRLVSQDVAGLSEELGLNGSPKIMQIVSAELVSPPLCSLLSWENFPSITYT